MADKDVNYYIDQINAAVRGEDVRSAIIALLEMANSGASNAYTLNGLTSDAFARQSDMEQILPLRTDPEVPAEPTEGGTRPISSGDLYTYLTENIIEAINKILRDNSTGTIESKIADLAECRKLIENAIIAKSVPVDKYDTFESFAQKIRSIQTETNYEIIDLRVTKNGEYHPEAADQAYRNVEVNVTPDLTTKTITAPGTYKAKDDDKDGYSEVTVKLSTGGSGSETAALVSKTIDLSNLPEPGASSLSKTFHPSEDGAKAVGYSEVTVNLNGLVGEKPVIEVDASAFGEEQVYEAKNDGIHGYSKITIRVVEQEGPFTVTFWNDANKWDTVTGVVKNSTAYPTKGDPTPPEGKMFTGWNPQPINVTRDLDCYAQFEEKNIPSTDSEIQDSWEEIGQTGGANIPNGAYKLLHFGEFEYDGMTYDEGAVMMVKVNGTPKTADSGAKSTWISAAPLGVYGGHNTPYDFRWIERNSSYDQKYIKGWVESDLRKMLRTTFLSAIAQANDPMYGGSNKIVQYIKSSGVTKYTYSTGPDGTIVENFPTTDETIWLPSGREIWQAVYSQGTSPKETNGNRYPWPSETQLPSGYTHNWSVTCTRSSDGQNYKWTTQTQWADLNDFLNQNVGINVNIGVANQSGNYSRSIYYMWKPEFLSAYQSHYGEGTAPARGQYEDSLHVLIGFNL